MSKNSNQKHKTMATSEDEYFNYHKMEHFRSDYKIPDYKLLKKNENISNAKKKRNNSPRPQN